MRYVLKRVARRGLTRSGVPRRAAFVLPAVGLLTVFFWCVGAASVLVGPKLGDSIVVAPRLRFDPVPSAGADVAWSDRVALPERAERVGLRKLVLTSLGLVGLTGAVALFGLMGLWRVESVARRSEVAIRRAVGASRRRLARERIVETLVLASAAGALGVALTGLAQAVVDGTWPGVVDDTLPGPVPLAAAGVMLSIALVTLVRGLASSARTTAGVAPRGAASPAAETTEGRAPPLLGVVQLSCVTAVLVTGVLILAASAPDLSSDSADRSAEYRRLEVRRLGDGIPLERLLSTLGGLSGVEDLHATSPGVVLGLGVSDGVLTECGDCWTGDLPTPMKGRRAVHHLVTLDTFRALGLRVTEGRPLAAADPANGELVAVVSESFARGNFENGDPIGRGISVGRSLERWYTVVGVVEDAAAWTIGAREQPDAQIYLSALQHDPGRADLLLSGPVDEDALGSAVRAAGWTVVEAGPLSGHLREHRARVRWFGAAWTLLSFGGLLMATFGVFSTMNLLVLRQAPEVGIRRAFGARRSRILVRYLWVGLKVAGPGLAIGLWLSLFAIPHLPTLPAPDAGLALVIAAAVVLPLLLATILGAWVPARRAAWAQPRDAIEGILR